MNVYKTHDFVYIIPRQFFYFVNIFRLDVYKIVCFVYILLLNCGSGQVLGRPRTQLDNSLPIIGLLARLGNFIFLFLPALCAFVDDLIAFAFFVDKSVRMHQASAAIFSIAWHNIDMKRYQAKGTVVSDTAIFDRQYFFVTIDARKACIFFLFSHSNHS
jgi:hypothetical protein